MRCLSVLRKDNNEANATTTTTKTNDFNLEAFVQDLEGYTKHRDRSVVITRQAWTNFAQETNPSLLQGKDWGATRAALYRVGEKPLRYGESCAAACVHREDLLLDYKEKR